jgi:DNA-binding transcriptional ArsR family regulator
VWRRRRWSCSCVATQVDLEPSTAQITSAVELLKAVAVEARLRILWALLHSEHSVNELADHLSANPPAVSQHLAHLRELELVTTRRQGNFIFYACDDTHVRAVATEAFSHAKLIVAGRKASHRTSKPARR